LELTGSFISRSLPFVASFGLSAYEMPAKFRQLNRHLKRVNGIPAHVVLMRIAINRSPDHPPAILEHARRREQLPDYLTVGELAAYLQVSKQSADHMRSAGTAPRAVAFGKHLRFPREAVLAWVEGAPLAA
jgi:excisionase family DNA binding protein